jgi:signal transduction histidine kinase
MGVTVDMEEKVDRTNTKILIVEDSPTQALELQYFLENNHFQADIAFNGEEAWEKIQKEPPHIVVTDVVMPGMDGFDLCQKIRQNPDTKNLPLILLTQLSDPRDVIRGLESGANNFITKPFKEDLLISRIEYILINQEMRKHQSGEMGVEIYFSNQRHFITSDRLQIIDLLLSTYDSAIQKNVELEQLNVKLKVMKEEIEERNKELQDLNNQKNELLGIAAHDIRNPITVIKGYADLLISCLGATMTPEQLEMVAVIQKNSQFMIQLLNDLLDFSAIESGNLNLSLQNLDLVAVIRENITVNRLISNQKKISLTLRAENNLPLVLFDKLKIQQVLNNLISNAIKYSFPDSEIVISVFKKDKSVVVSISDRGQGIPQNELEKLFKPFQKTSVKSTGGEKSTGLGLMIVKKIITGHHGEIWVESQEGKGSTFNFSLPFSEE